MKTEINKKRIYLTPEVERIKLDNEISLQMESVPPTGPNEISGSNTIIYHNNDPFRNMA
ncbi:MAG TPA: hypothetical protein PKH58_03130 [Paludibacteraceae bacterium]|nr:hypothetical protein [Paludibacteraceae bacterium]